MNFVLPFLAAVFQASSYILDKAVLSIRGISFKTYAGVSFPLVFAVNLTIFYIVKPPFNLELFSSGNLWLILVSVGLASVSNFIFFRALKEDRLSEILTFDIFASISIIVFAGLFFSDERNLWIIIPALAASFAVIWAHIDHRHFKIARHTLPFFLWTIVAAPLGSMISKILLAEWNPVSLELTRSALMAAIFGPMFFKYAERASFRSVVIFILTSMFTAVAWLFYFFSYQRSGIVFTTLLFSLEPVLIYLGALVFFKESLQAKKVTAFVVVLVSIIAAQVIKQVIKN